MISARAKLALVLLLLSTSGSAWAACSDEEARTFARSLGRTLACWSRTLSGSQQAPCPQRPIPECAEAAFTDLTNLLGGAPTAASQDTVGRRCQSRVYRAASGFLRKRLTERRKGRRRAQRSLAASRLGSRCVDQPHDVDAWPRVGSACAPDRPGSLRDHANDTMQCLRTELEAAVNSLLGIPPVRPNVIVIMTDDQHPQGMASLAEVQERILDRGVSFTNAFTTTPICAPSRAGFLTGQHAPRHGVRANVIPVDGVRTEGARTFATIETLATWFAEAGYTNALHGKYMNNYDSVAPAVPPGWDDWRVFRNDSPNFFDYDLVENGTVVSYGSSPEDYSTDVLRELSLRFIEDHADVPFFLYFAPFAPHDPSIPAPRHEGSLEGFAPWRPPSWAEDITDKPGWLNFFASTREGLIERDAEILDHRETLLAVDEAVATLLDRVEELGLSDNTIVVFCSDHGFSWGEHSWFGKQVPYEETIRIPLALRYPLRFDAERRDEFVLNIDVAPTLASLAGLEPPANFFDGNDLSALIDTNEAWRTDFVVQHFEGGFTIPPWDALRSQTYKYVRHPNDREELYDLVADPFELDNQGQNPAYATILAGLSARLDSLLR